MAKMSSKKKSNSSGGDRKPSDAGTPSKAEGRETTAKNGAGGSGGDRSPLDGVVSPKTETGGDIMEERETGFSVGYQAPEAESAEETAEETVEDKDEDNLRRCSANGKKPSDILIPARTSEDSPVQQVVTSLLFYNELMTISDAS